MSIFKIRIIGSSSIVPTKKRSTSAFLVEAAGQKVLLDCGFGTIRRLLDFGYALEDFNNIFISHFHPDHLADAFPLVHSRWVSNLYNGINNTEILFLGPLSLAKRFNLWRKIFWVEPKEYYPVKFIEGAKKIKLGKLDVELFPVKHVKWFNSVGIILRYRGKKIVYTGDVGSSQNFIDLVNRTRNADLLIIEAAADKPTPNHYTIEQVKALKERAQIKKVLIVHIRPQQENKLIKFCRPYASPRLRPHFGKASRDTQDYGGHARLRRASKEKEFLLKNDGDVVNI